MIVLRTAQNHAKPSIAWQSTQALLVGPRFLVQQHPVLLPMHQPCHGLRSAVGLLRWHSVAWMITETLRKGGIPSYNMDK